MLSSLIDSIRGFFITCSPKTTKYIMIFAVLLLIILEKTGYLGPIKDFLDSEVFAIYFRLTRISLYTILRDLLVLSFIVYLANIISSTISTKIKSIGILEPSNKALIAKAFQITIYFICSIIALHFMGIDITALAVFSGAIGIGIGIGLQKITSNFISGIILLFEQSVKEGDLIETSTGILGVIKQIAARYILIETPDGKEVIIPNEDFITNHVVNWTFSNKKARCEIILPLDYETDIEKAINIVLLVSHNDSSVLHDPEGPKCDLKNFDNGSANLKFCFWVENVTEGVSKIKSQILLNIWKEFRKNNIKFSSPVESSKK